MNVVVCISLTSVVLQSMFMQEDFKHIREASNNKLQWFPANTLSTTNLNRNAQKPELGYLAYLKVDLNEYAALASMHGINRIFESKSSRSKRITWIVALVLCLLVLMYVSFRVGWTYHTKPLVTVVANTHYPVFRIPFPEVTICNINRLNWQRFEMAQRMFMKPWHQASPKYREIFAAVVNAYDTLTFETFYKFKNLTKIPPAVLKELSYINFQSVAEFMAWKCHEIFSECRWLDDVYSCCDIFFMRNSQLGSCLAFNTVESADGLDKQRLDSFWPWRTKEPGIFNGLSVRVHLREQDHSSMQSNKKGILVMLAEPSVWSTRATEIDTHTQTSISINGILFAHSDPTRIISEKVRECLFQDELNSQYYKTLANRPYMYENCQSQCQLEYMAKFCNCTIGLFYPPGSYAPCRLSDFPCLYYHNDKFRNFEETGESKYVFKQNSNNMRCTCLYNCNSLRYPKTITTAYMNHLVVDFNNSFVDLNVFFQKEFIMEFMTTVVYTLPVLMASFGGLAGLCVGCSLLSLVEIAYFLIIDVSQKTVLYFEMRKHLRWRRKSRDVKVQIMNNILEN